MNDSKICRQYKADDKRRQFCLVEKQSIVPYNDSNELLNLSLLLLQGHLWPRVLKPVRVKSIDQIELFDHLQYWKPLNCVQTIDKYLIELLVLYSNVWNYLNVGIRMNNVE